MSGELPCLWAKRRCHLVSLLEGTSAAVRASLVCGTGSRPTPGRADRASSAEIIACDTGGHRSSGLTGSSVGIFLSYVNIQLCSERCGASLILSSGGSACGGARQVLWWQPRPGSRTATLQSNGQQPFNGIYPFNKCSTK